MSEHGNSVVNLIDKQGYTPVHWAVIEGTKEIVRYLIDLDADFENGFMDSNDSVLTAVDDFPMTDRMYEDD